MNGDAPSCVWCDDGGYYDCGEPPHCEEGLPQNVMETSEYIGEVVLQPNKIYYVRCRPGCCAFVDEDSTPPRSPWKPSGTLDTNPGGVPAGKYKVYLVFGGRGGCRALVKPA